MRNQEIYEQYKNGISVSQLAEIYVLTKKSVQRIIRKEGQKYE